MGLGANNKNLNGGTFNVPVISITARNQNTLLFYLILFNFGHIV